MTTPPPVASRPQLRLLVVCTANRCRSPIGEVIALEVARQRGLNIAVCSAGTDAVAGAPATDGAITTMRRQGLDLGQHTSRPVTESLVAAADLVVAMERRHVVDLVNIYDSDVRTTFTLP